MLALRAQYCMTKNLQKHADTRVWVVHWDMEKTSKQKFIGIKAEKEGINDLDKHAHWAKRMKAVNDHECLVGVTKIRIQSYQTHRQGINHRGLGTIIQQCEVGHRGG